MNKHDKCGLIMVTIWLLLMSCVFFVTCGRG